jgi:hypothetical protein
MITVKQNQIYLLTEAIKSSTIDSSTIPIIQTFSAHRRRLPILFFFLYLNFTFLFFIIGPWPFPVSNFLSLFSFLACAHLALLLGYLSVAFRQPRTYSGQWKIEHIIFISLAVNLVLMFPTAQLRTGSMLPNAVYGIINPGDAYITLGFYQQQFRQGFPLIEYIRILFGPLLVLLLPLVIFYWKRLSLIVRVLSLFSNFYMIAIFIAMGTNKLIMDFIFQVPWLLLASHFSSALPIRLNRKILYSLGTSVLFILAFTYFFATMNSRISSSASSGYLNTISIYVDYENFLIRDLPPTLQVGIIGFHSYLTQGYYGLSLALKEPFIPMYGYGNSMYLNRIAAGISDNFEIMNLPYPMRLQKYGWDGYVQWSSIYPWIASDVSFPGTVLVVFFIGHIFALSWLDTLEGSNPFAVAVFSQFIVMLFYFPANNQLLQTGEGLTGFIVSLCLWGLTRRKFNHDVRKINQ